MLQLVDEIVVIYKNIYIIYYIYYIYYIYTIGMETLISFKKY